MATSLLAGSKVRFQVIIEGRDYRKMPTRRVHSAHGSEGAAIIALAGVLRAWATEPSSVQPQTKVSIVDRNDGGKILMAQYFGPDPDLFTER